MNIKGQKGSATLYVLVAMLVVTTIAVGIFVQSANKQQMQLEAIEQLQKTYDSNMTPEEAYQKYMGNEVIPVKTTSQLLKIGSGETVIIDGKAYTFNEGNTYVLKNDIVCDESVLAVENLVDNGRVSLEMQGYKIISPVIPKEKVFSTSKNNYIDTNNAKATIPKGFTVSGIASEQTIANGLVVYDIPYGENVNWDTEAGREKIRQNYNQWVWVPVPSPSDMYQTVSGTLGGTTGVAVTRESKSITFSKENYTSQVITRNTAIGTGEVREPGLATDSDYDGNLANRLTADERFTSIETMGQALVDDYNEMIDSVIKYGGFYIGRYELTGSTSNPTEKPGISLTDINWYNLYASCKKFTKSNIVEARMVWGNQWDEICKFLDRRGYNVLDSKEYGNHVNVTVKASDGTVLKQGGTEESNKVKLETGITTYTKANNIYDLAGNCFEWTQDVYSTINRVYRGGSCRYNSGYSITCRFYNSSIINVYASYSSRPTLYIKLNAE